MFAPAVTAVGVAILHAIIVTWSYLAWVPPDPQAGIGVLFTLPTAGIFLLGHLLATPLRLWLRR